MSSSISGLGSNAISMGKTAEIANTVGKNKAADGVKDSGSGTKAEIRTIVERTDFKQPAARAEGEQMGGTKKAEGTRPDLANKDVAPQNNPIKEMQAFMTQLLRGDSSTIRNDTVGRQKPKNDGESKSGNPQSDVIHRNDKHPQPANVGRMANRRRDEDEEDEGGGQRRRRKPAQLPNNQKKATPSIIEGARVGESQTQDMFVSSSFTQERITGAKLNKSVTEQIKEYNDTDLTNSIYNVVSANYNHKEKNGIGPNMQKDLFGEMLLRLSKIEDVVTPEYKRATRDIIQGAMRAGYESGLEMKDLVKMLVSGFMAMSHHDDDIDLMSEVVKYIVSEIMYGKINIGYNMKSASMWLGAASYTLVLYYKEYQNEIEFSHELEQGLNIAFSENIWKSTGEISNYSQVSAKANVEQFMTGRMEEEKLHSSNYVKSMVLSPLKRVFNKVKY